MKASLPPILAMKGAKAIIIKARAATVSIGLPNPRTRQPNLRPSALTEPIVTANIDRELAVTTEALTSGFKALTFRELCICLHLSFTPGTEPGGLLDSQR